MNVVFVGDRDIRKFTTGYVFSMGGSTISWKSKLQSMIALSTIEAKYIAIIHVVKRLCG